MIRYHYVYVGIKCRIPENGMHSYPQYDDLEAGNSAVYKCNYNGNNPYTRVSGNVTRICSNMGKWIGSALQCGS